MGKYDDYLQGRPRRVADNQLEIDQAATDLESGVDRLDPLRAELARVGELLSAAAKLPRDPSPRAWASQYYALRDIRDEIDGLGKRIGVVYNGFDALLVRAYDHQDSTFGSYGAKPNQIRLETGGSVFVEAKPHAKVINPEEYRAWCVNNGYERQLQLLWQTTNGIVKKRLEEGLPDLPGIEVQVDIGLTKRKK